MNKKLKRAQRTAFFIMIFFVLCGSLLIYRSGLTSTDYKSYDGILEEAEALGGFGKNGRRYAIVLSFKDSNKKYGFYAGTKEQALRTYNNLNLQKGWNYKVYLDHTILSKFNGINLGIRKIETENKVVFEENMNGHRVMGIVLIAFGVTLSSSLFLFARRRFK